MSSAQDTRGGGTAELRLRVAAFNLLPVTYIHPERLAEVLPARLPERLREELLGCRRLRFRLSQRILAATCSEACEAGLFDAPERRFALRGRDGLARVLRLAGAAWHGGFLKTVIAGGRLREILERLGAEARDFALANLDLSAPFAREIAIAELQDSVDRDGLGCLKAWSAGQPRGFRERLALMLPAADWGDGVAEPRHRARGPGILRQAALELKHDD